jgi:hypothetical protein
VVTCVAEQRVIHSYSEFWLHYLREHSSRRTRLAHYAGTSLALGAAIVFAVTGHWVWLLAMPILGYGCAWVGHGLIEHNTPATFTYPMWSLLSDLRMFFLAVTGRLGPHLRAARSAGAHFRQSA